MGDRREVRGDEEARDRSGGDHQTEGTCHTYA